MKCPRCPRNPKHKDGMTCPCGYRFALDPKTDGMSDRRFVAFINAASCNGTYSFTETQLYTAACRKQLEPPASMTSVVIFAISSAVFATLAAVAGPVFLILSAGTFALTLFAICTWIWYRFIKQLPVRRFAGWLKKYSNSHGPIKGMIESDSLSEPPPEVSEPDLYDYGVERVLVVQRPILVDLLIANKIHLANRSVIVSGDGYPSYLAATVQKLLQDSPTLPVFLLHDADEAGSRWATEQTARYQSSDRPVVDMGLNCETVKLIRKLRPLKLKEKQYCASVDVLPMMMLANGIALSMEQNVAMKELLINETSVDTLTSFG